MITKQESRAIETIRRGTKSSWPGLYRGRVESIDDPDRLGRVKVRVWALHGDDPRTPTSALPWAEIAESGGGGYDYGSFDPPPMGSAVWVGFEGAKSGFPVVLGTFRGVPKRDADNPNIFLVKDGVPLSEKPWSPPDEGLETPLDVFEDVYNGDPHPTRRVWKKSFKGHTIVVEDGDGKEFLKIIDRSGQIIEMDCPVAQTYSEGNAAQRGNRDSIRGDQLSNDIMEDGRASIRIRDLSGQEIVLDATNNKEQITIRSRNRLGSSENKIVLASGNGRDKIELVDTSGNSISLDPHSTEPIKIQDVAGNKILFDKAEGKIKIVSAKISEEAVPQKLVTVDGSMTSTIGGDEVKTIQGSKKTQVVNDTAFGTLGNTTISLGGSAKILITNMAPSGPEVKALDVVIGNALVPSKFSLSNQNGDMSIETLLGSVSMKTTLGQANLDGTTVHLGSLLSAVEPLIKGTKLSTDWIADLTQLASTVAPLISGGGVPNPFTNSAAIITLATALVAYVTSLSGKIPLSLSTKSFTS